MNLVSIDETATEASTLKGFIALFECSNYFFRGSISSDRSTVGTNDAFDASSIATLSKEEKGLSRTMHWTFSLMILA